MSIYEKHRQRKLLSLNTEEEIGIDNRCSTTISNRISDFVGDMHKSKKCVKGYTGTSNRPLLIGTIRWEWEDDQGRSHQFRIPNS